jgi:hypothetical protein
MVSPKKRPWTTSASSSGSGGIDCSNTSGGGYGGTPILVVKILLVLLILFLLPKLVTTSAAGGAAAAAEPITGTRPTGRGRRIKNRKQLNRQYYSIRSSCENGSSECADVILEESVPCVTRCISSACHDRVYGDSPLEAGEVDRLRYAEFEACAKKEVKEAARLERIERRRKASGVAVT